VIFELLVVARQLFVLLFLSVGCGCWLWLFSGRPSLCRGRSWVWFGLAGFCAHTLVLQSLVYLGLPLNVTAWPALSMAAGGVVFGLWECRKRPSLRTPVGEVKFIVLVFVAGFFGQAPGLLVLGPERYFGSGSYDHANYVVTAEFFRGLPFSTTAEEVAYRPWLVRALEAKEQRVTQSVALGALAEIDGTSAQASYGVMSAFFVGLAGVATAAWLRGTGLARGAAGWAGVIAALTPALTRIQLDGFFSQTATLFVYPALAGLLSGRNELSAGRKLCAAVLLAFLIGSYTEVAVLGVAVVTVLVVANGSSWRRRGRDLSLILVGALLLNPGFLGRLPDFLFAQARLASNPDTLKELFPDSGTWLGWGRLFFDGLGERVATLLGLAVLGAGSLFAVPSGRRTHWRLTVGVALLPLVVLRLAPQFSGYAFAKLTVQFVPIWVGAAMMGWIGWVGVSVWRRRLTWIVGGLGAVIVAVGAAHLHRAVVESGGRLSLLSSDAMLRVRRDVESSPERPRLVGQSDPLLAQWFCYFARGGNVVLDRRSLGDRIVPSESYEFRRWKEEIGDLWWLDVERTGKVEGYEPLPRLVVRGALEVGPGGFGREYLVGDGVEFVFDRGSDPKSVRNVWFDFVAVPMTPETACELKMEGVTGDVQQTTLRRPGWLRWRVALPPGESTYRLSVSCAEKISSRSGRVLLKLLSVEVSLVAHERDPQPVELPARK
jgi:hypothetical protein